MPQPSRNLTLDVLRAVAVLLVLGRHMPMPPVGVAGREFLLTWVQGGWIGVDLFFVLSGFLVSGLLFQEYQRRGTISGGRFLIRRGFKIYPGFWALVAVTLLAGSLIGGITYAPRRIFVELLFLQNYTMGLWAHTWSLAVEEHFYLLLPGLVWLLARRRPGSADPFAPIVPIFVVLASAALAGRCAVGWSSNNIRTYLFATHLRLDSLLMGVVVSYAWHFQRAWFERTFARRRVGMLLAGIGLLAPAFLVRLGNPFIHTVGLTCFYLGGAALLIGMLFVPMPRLPGVRFLAFLGAHSYAIYLWHIPLFMTLNWARQRFHMSISYPQFLGVYLVGSLVVGVVLAKLIEFPFLKLRDRWFPSQLGKPVDKPPASLAPLPQRMAA